MTDADDCLWRGRAAQRLTMHESITQQRHTTPAHPPPGPLQLSAPHPSAWPGLQQTHKQPPIAGLQHRLASSSQPGPMQHRLASSPQPGPMQHRLASSPQPGPMQLLSLQHAGLTSSSPAQLPRILLAGPHRYPASAPTPAAHGCSTAGAACSHCCCSADPPPAAGCGYSWPPLAGGAAARPAGAHPGCRSGTRELGGGRNA